MMRKSSRIRASYVKPLLATAVIVGAALAYDRLRHSDTEVSGSPQIARVVPKAGVDGATSAVPMAGPPREVSNPVANSAIPVPDQAALMAANDSMPAQRPQKARPLFTPSAPPKVGLDDARLALSLLGTDAEAEGVWLEAINDSNISPHDRKNLIEDLNETGFADPKNLTQADLPMIVARLELIERNGPDAWDETNAAAFQEAYKDLSAMYDRLTR